MDLARLCRLADRCGAAVVYPRLVMRVGEAVASGGGDAARGVAGVRRVLTLNTVEITILLLIVVDMAVKLGVG